MQTTTQGEAKPSLLGWASGHLARRCGYYAVLALAMTFAALFARALAQGGRWDLYEPVAMADRLAQLSYSTGTADGFVPSTPYFLGVALISYAAKAGGPFQVELLLFVATALIFAMLSAMYLVYRRIGGKRSFVIYLATAATITVICLNRYLDYALEFKPDTPALIFFALLTALVLSDLKLPRRLVYLTLCAAGAALFKQQILVAMAALCAARVLWGHPLRDRLTDVISISLGACIGLAISLSIENAFFFTIISHMGRPTVKLLDMAHAELLVRVALLAAAALALHGLRGALKQTARVGRILPYSVPAAAWLLICLAGARNLGGNSGNTAVGLALLLPFAALLLDRMDVRLRSMMFIAVTLFSATYLVVSDWRERYRGRVTTEIQVAQELRRIGADHVLASGDSYVATRRADVAKISEIDVWAHIHNGRSGGVVPPDGPALIAEVRPDAIVCLQGCNVFARYDFDPVAAGYSEINVPASALKGVLYVRDQSLPNAGNAVAP